MAGTASANNAREKGFLCEVPRSPWAMLHEPICRACCNCEGISDAIDKAKRLRRSFENLQMALSADKQSPQEMVTVGVAQLNADVRRAGRTCTHAITRHMAIGVQVVAPRDVATNKHGFTILGNNFATRMQPVDVVAFPSSFAIHPKPMTHITDAMPTHNSLANQTFHSAKGDTHNTTTQRFAQIQGTLYILSRSPAFGIRFSKDHSLIGRLIAFGAVCRRDYKLKAYPIGSQTSFQSASGAGRQIYGEFRLSITGNLVNPKRHSSNESWGGDEERRRGGAEPNGSPQCTNGVPHSPTSGHCPAHSPNATHSSKLNSSTGSQPKMSMQYLIGHRPLEDNRFVQCPPHKFCFTNPRCIIKKQSVDVYYPSGMTECHSFTQCWAFMEQEISILEVLFNIITYTGAHVLTTNANLYAEDSPLKMAFSQQDYGNLQLDLQNADHRKFIVDLSFQLSECERLGHYLQLEKYHIERIQADYSNVTEQTYQLLRMSLSRMPNVTLGQLQHALKGLGVTGLALRIPVSEEWELRWDSVCVNDDDFVRNLGVKLQYRWKFIGRLLELDEQDLNGIEYCNCEDLGEQSYQMLLRWRKQCGNGATYGRLLTAIQSVFDHDSANICDAWVYAMEYLHDK